MWSSAVTKSGQRGTWTAEPDNVIHVHPESGIGVVISSQAIKVFIQYDITPSSKVVFNVEPVSEISFVYDHSKILTNTNGDEFRVPVLFKDAENPHKTTNFVSFILTIINGCRHYYCLFSFSFLIYSLKDGSAMNSSMKK